MPSIKVRGIPVELKQMATDFRLKIGRWPISKSFQLMRGEVPLMVAAMVKGEGVIQTASGVRLSIIKAGPGKYTCRMGDAAMEFSQDELDSFVRLGKEALR